MSSRKRTRVQRMRMRWGEEVMAAVTIVVLSIVGLVLTENGVLDPRPWRYICVAAAILAAVTAMVFTIIEAEAEGKGEVDPPDDSAQR